MGGWSLARWKLVQAVHIAKRFPLMQGGKLRLKDDFTAETVDMAEKLRVESVDELAANILATILKAGAQPE